MAANALAKTGLLCLCFHITLTASQSLLGGDSAALDAFGFLASRDTDSLAVARAPRDQCPGSFPGASGQLPFFRYPPGLADAEPACPNPRPSCGTAGCGAKWGNNGTATCTSAGPLQDCGCIPDKNLCGTPALCDVPNCNGSLDIATGGYTCKKWWAPCECKPSPAMCGEPKPCEDNGCGGDFGPNEVHATCKAKFKGCECKPSPKICGKAPSCDNCAGGWQAGTNKPVCSTVRFGCPCIPGSLCGSLAGCDDNGCVGAFPPADPRVAKCTGAFEGCACRPGKTQCGQERSCHDGGCVGGIVNGFGVCSQNYQGCPCILDSANLPPPSGGLCSDVAECSNGNCRGPPPVGGGDKGKCASNSNRPGCSCHYTVPDLAPADSAYCVGIYVQDCQQQPCTPKYSLGYARSGGDVVYVDPDLRTDIRSLCGATMDGAQVVCDKDTARVNAQCTGDYGVAFFKSRSCRTICPQQDGSNPRCMQRQPPGAPYSEYITKLFVCDRYLPPWY